MSSQMAKQFKDRFLELIPSIQWYLGDISVIFQSQLRPCLSFSDPFQYEFFSHGDDDLSALGCNWSERELDIAPLVIPTPKRKTIPKQVYMQKILLNMLAGGVSVSLDLFAYEISWEWQGFYSSEAHPFSAMWIHSLSPPHILFSLFVTSHLGTNKMV